MGIYLGWGGWVGFAFCAPGRWFRFLKLFVALVSSLDWLSGLVGLARFESIV